MNTQLEKILAESGNITLQSKELKNVLDQFQDLMMRYNSAIREVRTKLEVLNDEFQVKSRRNPIRYIKHRIKKPESIMEKLKRQKNEISMDSIVNNLNDIAGIRVVCAYVSDIYNIAEMLEKQDDINVLIVKDYIKNPKPNGYRSLHLVLEIPVFFTDRKQYMKVEVQIRTMAMDFWASLEHQLKYKTDHESTEEIVSELRDCAEIIHETDCRMQTIHQSMNGIGY